MPGPNEPWFLNTYSRMSTIEGGKVASSCYVFDADRGYLRAERRMKTLGTFPMTFGSVSNAAAPTSPEDFLKLYSRVQESPIEVTLFEEDYGGDLGGLPTWAFADGDYQFTIAANGTPNLPAGSQAAYTLATTMRYGAKAASA